MDELALKKAKMTHDDLMALPDVTPRFGVQEKVIDGRKVRVPVAPAAVGALFQKEDDGMFTDAAGKSWMVGWADGQRVRRELA